MDHCSLQLCQNEQHKPACRNKEMAAGITGSDLCKDFSAAEDALALALCNSLFLLLAHRILLLIVPLGEHLY